MFYHLVRLHTALSFRQLCSFKTGPSPDHTTLIFHKPDTHLKAKFSCCLHCPVLLAPPLKNFLIYAGLVAGLGFGFFFVYT